MNKIIVFAVAALFALLPSALRAESYADVFSMDETSIQEEFAALNQLESYVLTQGTTVSVSALPSDIVPQNFNAAAGLNSPNFTIDDMDWGSFAWGFCCCPVGFFVVAISPQKDSAQKLSYWIGVGVGTILGAITNVIYYGASGTLPTTVL